MTLREFLCLLGAIVVYGISCFLLGLVISNVTLVAIISAFICCGAAIALDELTDKHRHGGW